MCRVLSRQDGLPGGVDRGARRGATRRRRSGKGKELYVQVSEQACVLVGSIEGRVAVHVDEAVAKKKLNAYLVSMCSCMKVVFMYEKEALVMMA